MATIK